MGGLVAAVIGLVFFLFAVGYLLFLKTDAVPAVISLIGGSLIEVISGVNFYLYGKTSAQLADFQTRLDHTQRYLLANSMVESLEGDSKQKTRAEVIRAIADVAPTSIPIAAPIPAPQAS